MFIARSAVSNLQMAPTSYSELCLIAIAVISPPEIILFLYVVASVRLLTNELGVFLSWILAWLKMKLGIPKCAIADQRWTHPIFLPQSQAKILLFTKIQFYVIISLIHDIGHPLCPFRSSHRRPWTGKGNEAQAQCRCRCRIFSRVMGGVWEDRLGRIERHLEKTCTRVPQRSPRTSSTLPGEMDSFHLSFSSHYVLDQIDPNAIELEADSDNRFLYKFEARTQKRKGKEMKGARLLEAKTGEHGRSSMVTSMGVEECVKTLQSTAEELVSRTSCSRCCMATQPDLPRQVRALRHRPRAHLAGE